MWARIGRLATASVLVCALHLCAVVAWADETGSGATDVAVIGQTGELAENAIGGSGVSPEASDTDSPSDTPAESASPAEPDVPKASDGKKSPKSTAGVSSPAGSITPRTGDALAYAVAGASLCASLSIVVLCLLRAQRRKK